MAADKPTATPTKPEDQRRALEKSEKQANRKQPRNYKEDADDKLVSVEPDGTGPTSTGSFDTGEDRRRGSGSETP